jgi:hypothetical protein
MRPGFPWALPGHAGRGLRLSLRFFEPRVHRIPRPRADLEQLRKRLSFSRRRRSPSSSLAAACAGAIPKHF